MADALTGQAELDRRIRLMQTMYIGAATEDVLRPVAQPRAATAGAMEVLHMLSNLGDDVAADLHDRPPHGASRCPICAYYEEP